MNPDETSIVADGLVVLLPCESLTTALKVAPLSACTASGVMYDALTAPLIGAPFFSHW